MKSISIGIVSHGHQDEIIDLLQSLDKNIEKDIKYEVILVENIKNKSVNSFDEYSYPLKIVINEKPVGLSVNINNIFSMVTGDYFCILNPDVVFIEKVFSGLIESMLKNEIDIIAPKVIDASGNIQDSFRHLPGMLELFSRYFRVPSTFDDFEENNPEFTDWLAGIFLLLRKDLFLQMSGYNERYFLYFEDVEFCSRARLQGQTIAVEKNFTITHNAQRRSRIDSKHMFWHIWSAVRFFSSKTYREVKRLEKKE